MDLSGRPLVNSASDGGLFVDRDRELDQIMRAVELQTNVLIFGARGSGRTSLLRFAAERVNESGRRAVFVEGALASSPLEFLNLLRYRIAPTVQSSGLFEQWQAAATVLRASAGGVAMRRQLEGLPGESQVLLDIVQDLKRHLTRRSAPHVAVVDEIPSPETAHTLFGRLRDELWQLPLTWVVGANITDRAIYQRPPADAFFPREIVLDPLDDRTARELVRRRVDKKILPDAALTQIVAEAKGSPRRLVQLANDAVAAGGDARGATSASARRSEKLSKLSEPAQRLAAELEAHGASSASDPALLSRLGWSRGRAAQVLRELADAGVVEGTTQRMEGQRPRKVYALK